MSELKTIILVAYLNYQPNERFQVNRVSISDQCAVSKVTVQVFEVQSFCLDTDPQSFRHSFGALSRIHCSKSAQKFAVRVYQVSTVAMETTQLVLSQLKNFLTQSTEN